MRTFGILILILILGINNSLIAQNYESLFGSDSTQWNITMGNLWGTGTDQHTVLKDTTINGNSYKVIDGYSIGGFQGYLREDTIQGKAWYRNNQGTTEFLIMDLELSVGDSMFVGGNWNPNPGYFFVDSVYTSNNRKHIRFDFELFFISNTKFTLIEGISSNLGFRYQDTDYINNMHPELLCSYKNGIQEYGIGQCLISGLNEINNEKNVKIFPNPTTGNITLNTELEINEINIIDISGKTIKTIITDFNIVDVSNLTNGIYFIKIINEEGSITKKFVKQ